MKTFLITALLCSSLLFVAAPASATLTDAFSTGSSDLINCTGSICSHYNPCIRTDATCGPWRDAWVYGEIDWGWIQVCVTSHLSHVLC